MPDLPPPDDPDGWHHDQHPWCRDFLLAVWQAIDACHDANAKAPQCSCAACCDLRAVAGLLAILEGRIDDQYRPGSGFPERILRIAGVKTAAELPRGAYRRWLAEHHAAMGQQP